MIRLLTLEDEQSPVDDGDDDIDVNWSAKCEALFVKQGCQLYSWKTSGTESGNSRYCYKIVREVDILRPVYLVPDFTRKLGVERGTSHCRELLSMG